MSAVESDDDGEDGEGEGEGEGEEPSPQLPRTPADELRLGDDVNSDIDPAVAESAAARSPGVEMDLIMTPFKESPKKLQHPSAIQSTLPPSLAALRTPSMTQALRPNPSAFAMSVIQNKGNSPIGSPPILPPTSKCSGYFVEPMKWMDPFLADGQMAGKIICPNTKCGVKLGNYDWAGVGCSCKEWVTPGFCIHKSKVDELS